VSAEAESLAALIPGARVLPRPEREAVLSALAESQVAHLACHGLVNWSDPAASGLILYDYLTSPLTVADISQLRLVSGLAYLSACDTTVTSLSLANEAVHITGAFYLAGYKHVVGTLWPIEDATAKQVALDFYRWLTRDGSVPPATDRSAEALHHAVRGARARHPGTPSRWAAYLHTGS
jgi:CHAT domain-containing protein